MTSDAGATWDLWPLPFEPMGWDLVECLGQSLIVMSGNYLYPFGSVSMLTRTNDGGEQWEDLAYYNTINNGYAIYFTSIMLADSGSLYVSGTDSFGKGVFLGFGNGGDSLSPGSSYYFKEGTSGVWFSTPMKGTIVGRGGSLPDFQRGTCECGAGGCEVHTGRFPPPAKLPESVQPVHNDPLCITAWIVRDARSLQHARAAGGYTCSGGAEADITKQCLTRLDWRAGCTCIACRRDRMWKPQARSCSVNSPSIVYSKSLAIIAGLSDFQRPRPGRISQCGSGGTV